MDNGYEDPDPTSDPEYQTPVGTHPATGDNAAETTSGTVSEDDRASDNPGQVNAPRDGA